MSNDPPASTSHAAQSPAPASKSQTGPTIGPSAAALRRIALIFTAWILAWWALVGVFLAGVIPGGWFTMAGVALASVAPVPVLMRGFRDDAYPSAWTRLFVLRPFWYVLLLVPLIALTAATAALLGWAFVDPLTAGRMGVFAAASLVISAAVIGYWGSRRLVVHHIDAAHPTLPAAFDGFRIAQLSDLHRPPQPPRPHHTCRPRSRGGGARPHRSHGRPSRRFRRRHPPFRQTLRPTRRARRSLRGGRQP